MADVLRRIARANRPAFHTLTPQEARAAYEAAAEVLEPSRAGLPRVQDLQLPGAQGALRARLYAPSHERLPVLLYLHGGGFTIGGLETHDSLCRQLASLSGGAVLSLDYRLAPEHRFPAAVDDAWSAMRWLAAQGDELGLDGTRLAVGGDSAGGTLAAVAALALRGQQPALALQLLLYPITGMAHALPSHARFSGGYGLERSALLWLRSQYLGGPADRPDEAVLADWRVSPLRAPDLSGLPPACIVVAGLDPLRDEGRAYAERLLAAGVPLTYEYFSGAIHGFALMSAASAAARHLGYRAGQALRNAFGGPGARRPPAPEKRP